MQKEKFSVKPKLVKFLTLITLDFTLITLEVILHLYDKKCRNPNYVVATCDTSRYNKDINWLKVYTSYNNFQKNGG